LWRGAFVDVLSAAYALDADRGASFAEHAENFGLDPLGLPLAVTVDECGAAQLAGAVAAIHELAVVLDDHAGRWFTSPTERRERRGGLDLVRTGSPGAVAARVLSGFRLRPPLVRE
jgi:hypothetical protein